MATLTLLAVLALQAPVDSPDCRPGDFDLKFDTLDPSAALSEPRWSQQDRTKKPADPQCCGNFPVGFPKGSDCTSDSIWLNPPSLGPQYFCDFGTSNFSGHINWAPASYQGMLSFTSKESSIVGDGDYTFELSTESGNGLTIHRPTIHVEMDGGETIGNARTGWFDDFRRASKSERRCMLRKTCPNGLVRVPAFVAGLLGIDNVHNAYSELHPIYGLALLADRQPGPGGYKDHWAVLARNWGDEGWCSSKQEYLEGLPPGGLAIRVPLPGLATLMLDKVEFRSNSAAVAGPQITKDSDGLWLRFVLPPPDQRPMVMGDIVLRWSSNNPQAVVSAGAALRVPPPDKEDEPGEELRSILEQYITVDEKRKIEPVSAGAGLGFTPKRTHDDVRQEAAERPAVRATVRPTEDKADADRRRSQRAVICHAATKALQAHQNDAQLRALVASCGEDQE